MRLATGCLVSFCSAMQLVTAEGQSSGFEAQRAGPDYMYIISRVHSGLEQLDAV